MNKFIISSQYFLYFGVLGIFLPYFNLYCHRIGFDGFQIGVLSALRSGALVIFPMCWAWLADRFEIRRTIYIFCNIVSTVLWAGYLCTTDFAFMFLITIVYSIFFAPIISFLEAFTMDILGSERKSYGRVRVWGSLAFITAVVLLGKLIDFHGIEIILVLILIGMLIQSAFAFEMPHITPDENISDKTSFISAANAFFSRHVVIFLVCAFLMLTSHGAYYGFFSIHLEELGYGNTFIGILWAIASTSEIFVMVNSHRIFKRFAIENILFFSFMVAGLRWLVLSFAESGLIILISQILHAITYGTFHVASILYIDQLTPDKTRTLGQAVNNAVTYGLGMMIGFFGSGYLYEKTDGFMLFLISSIIAFAGGIILKIFLIQSEPAILRGNEK